MNYRKYSKGGGSFSIQKSILHILEFYKELFSDAFRKNFQYDFLNMRGGKGRLEIFRKFIRFGIWSRFVWELAIWPKEVILDKQNSTLGPRPLTMLTLVNMFSKSTIKSNHFRVFHCEKNQWGFPIPRLWFKVNTRFGFLINSAED